MLDTPTPSSRPGRLYPVNRRYLETLTDELGIWQHASLERPDPAHGFCTDDVCRALGVDLLHARVIGWGAVAASVRRHLVFLGEAVGAPGRRFRNFRAADGTWLEEEGSEDCHGRALASLAFAMNEVPDPTMRGTAGRLFEQALPAVASLTALRATASTVIACNAALGAGAGDGAERTFELLAGRLSDAFTPASPDTEWPWPEPSLTYENALLPRALIVAGRRLGDASMTSRGRIVLDWLIESQTSSSGAFSPVGNLGWWPRGGEMSRFDQQPIEAMALILAAKAAFEVEGEPRYRKAAEMAYGWFLGTNDCGLPVAIPLAGGCHDGLTPKGLNLNQGAESTLAWLTALEHIRTMRAADSSVAAQARSMTPSGSASGSVSGSASAARS